MSSVAESNGSNNNNNCNNNSNDSNGDPVSQQLQSLLLQKQDPNMVTSPVAAAVVATTSNGAAVDTLTASMTIPSSISFNSNNNNTTSSTTGGYVLLQDFTVLDSISHFNRERIPERVVHAKGGGASGYFIVTNDRYGKEYCKSKMFSKIGIKTPVTVRFSTVGGENGSADTIRDPRGFAIKFFNNHDDNNATTIWDLVGNNTPIFFIRDPILFPSFIHTQKRNPTTHCKDATMMWDFISLRHETCHQITILFSDRGIPNGYRYMNGYGSHTYKNINTNDIPFYVKYHWKTDQGIQNLTTKQAQLLASTDPDYSIRDLYNSIATGNYPSWTLYVQIMTYEQAIQCSYNPFDLTKVWSQSQYPLLEVGRIVLTTNPINYYTDIEQLAFSPSHMINGIEPSPDKMLQVRLFSYPDTQRYRLGTNYQNLPTNTGPFNSNTTNNNVTNYQRDGSMQTSTNGTNQPNYYPNSFNGPQPIVHNNNNTNTTKTIVVESIPTTGSNTSTGSIDIVRTDTGDEDNYSQCQQFFCTVLNDDERERLTTNIATSLADVMYEPIQHRVIEMFTKVDRTYGRMVQDKLNDIVQQKKNVAPTKTTAESSYYSSPLPLNPPRIVVTSDGTNDNSVSSCPYGYGKSKL